MYRQLTGEFTLLSVVVCLVHSREYISRYCPNSQLPEIDAIGTIKHCLPGHEGLCGPGYSCYFSGTNYQCCPTQEEIDLDTILECPSPGITILTDAGLPLICIRGLHDCPQSSMQCLNVGKHSVCCEGSSSITEEPYDALSLKELNSPDEIIQPIALSNELLNIPNLECPEPAFTILNGNGDPLSCNEEDCAHQPGRFCYKILNTPICCEGEERAIDDDTMIKKILQEKHEKEGDVTWSTLKYTPITIAQHQLQQNQPSQNDSRLGTDVSSVARSPILESDSETKQTNLEVTKSTDSLANHFGEKQIDNQHGNSQQSIIPNNADTSNAITISSTTTPSISSTFSTTTSSTFLTTTSSTTTTRTTITTVTPTVITSTTSAFRALGKPNKKIQYQSLTPPSGESREDGNVMNRYKPHNAGGYAVSQAFSSKIRRAPNDLRALAREYLLEHIRRGWPYSDEFYRTYSEFYTIQISKNFV
ncbi:hypothetical protein X798_08007 [Onchocerca flexuosa]|uniref:Uncharacterized protein n=1 Tax=Onchocerca flexuosa TaxID=387005 RepID=A0A238BJ51_9BILA|nr:hypothetical protein X798_08007 [Onchocerca flexuosa]